MVRMAALGAPTVCASKAMHGNALAQPSCSTGSYYALAAAQTAGIRLTNSSPRSKALMLSMVVCMIWPIASSVKKA